MENQMLDDEDVRSILRHLMLLVLVCIFVCAATCARRGASPAAAQALFSPSDELSMARACAHEVTWAGGSRTADCGAMLQVVLLRQRTGQTFAQALARTMPRFTAGTTSRVWATRLPRGPLPVGLELPGWVAPERPAAHSASWQAVQARVHAYMSGHEPLPCAQEPWHWFSPREDGNAIHTRLDSGRWMVADCGTVANVYLYAVDVD